MTKKMLVVSVEDNRIKTVPCEKEECSTCSMGCDKKKTIVEVLNPKNIPVKAGTLVIIGATKTAELIQGIVSLFFPFLSAVAGYFCAEPIAALFGKTISSDAKALFVLLFLLVSSAIVFIVTRKHPLPGKAVILDLA